MESTPGPPCESGRLELDAMLQADGSPTLAESHPPFGRLSVASKFLHDRVDIIANGGAQHEIGLMVGPVYGF